MPHMRVPSLFVVLAVDGRSSRVTAYNLPVGLPVSSSSRPTPGLDVLCGPDGAANRLTASTAALLQTAKTISSA